MYKTYDKMKKTKSQIISFFKKRTVYLKTFIYIIIFIYFEPILPSEVYYSKIILKFKDIKSVKIFGHTEGDLYAPNPDKVYLNGIIQSEIKSFYESTENVDNVTLIWINNIVDSTYSLFHSCEEIREIDLSQFDTSQITNMAEMFYGCSKLYSLNLRNLDTSHVTNTSNIFENVTA